MSTTYWALRRVDNGWWWSEMDREWYPERGVGSRLESLDAAMSRRATFDPLINYATEVKSYRVLTREESRARAEARGEVRALENLIHGYVGTPPEIVAEYEKLLTDARKRAGR